MPSVSNMKTRWHLPDILDLEYFLHRDEAQIGDPDTAKAMAQRDRGIYLAHIQPKMPGEEPRSRRFILKSWLSQRRFEERTALPEEAPLPGEIYREIYRLLWWLFALFGVLSGAGLASSFLIYQGTEPLNVAYYFGGLILSQFLLMLLLVLIISVRLVNRSFTANSVLYSLISRLLVRFFLWVQKTDRKKPFRNPAKRHRSRSGGGAGQTEGVRIPLLLAGLCLGPGVRRLFQHRHHRRNPDQGGGFGHRVRMAVHGPVQPRGGL